MNIAFFNTKPYDRLWFEPLSKEYGMKIHGRRHGKGHGKGHGKRRRSR